MLFFRKFSSALILFSEYPESQIIHFGIFGILYAILIYAGVINGLIIYINNLAGKIPVFLQSLTLYSTDSILSMRTMAPKAL